MPPRKKATAAKGKKSPDPPARVSPVNYIVAKLLKIVVSRLDPYVTVMYRTQTVIDRIPTGLGRGQSWSSVAKPWMIRRTTVHNSW